MLIVSAWPLHDFEAATLAYSFAAPFQIQSCQSLKAVHSALIRNVTADAAEVLHSGVLSSQLWGWVAVTFSTALKHCFKY